MKKLLLLIVLLFTSTAYALNFSFLDYSAVYYFTPDDWTIMQKTLEKTLNTGKNNIKVSWRNAETGASGFILPRDTTWQNGTQCRNVTVANFAHRLSNQSTFQFCKINGEWKVAS